MGSSGKFRKFRLNRGKYHDASCFEDLEAILSFLLVTLYIFENALIIFKGLQYNDVNL